MTTVLEVQNVSKHFGATEVLTDINFDLHKGEVLSIIGSSGSGKTTLLRCLNFLETPDGGRIIVNGETLFDGADSAVKSEEAIRKNRLHFGLVFQNFNLFPQYSALQNIMLAMEMHATERPDYRKNRTAVAGEIREKAASLLSQVGLSDKAANYPHQLSGGQQQRVASARALALNPDILCVDEPTRALDPEISGEVLNTIRALANQNMTMIIVTHEMGFARDVSSRVLFMADGRIMEEGTPEDIFGSPKTQRLQTFLSAVR